MTSLMESTEQSQELRAGTEPASNTEPNFIPTFNESNKEPDDVGVTYCHRLKPTGRCF